MFALIYWFVQFDWGGAIVDIQFTFVHWVKDAHVLQLLRLGIMVK